MSPEKKQELSEEAIQLDKELFDIEKKVGNFEEYCKKRSEEDELVSKYYFTTILQAIQQFAANYPKLDKSALTDIDKKLTKFKEQIKTLQKNIKEDNFISTKKLSVLLQI